jgi:GTP-binding protein EngB required for normal cell division
VGSETSEKIRSLMREDVSIESQNRQTNRTSTNADSIKRVVIIGDSEVGKTSIVKRIVVIYLLQIIRRKSNSARYMRRL